MAKATHGLGVLATVGIFGLVTLILLHVFAGREAQERNHWRLIREQADASLHLELSVRQRIVAVESLQAFVLATRKLPDFSAFDRFAETLMQLTPAAKGYAYGDANGVLRHFYPLTGNEEAIGLNIYSRPGAAFLRKSVQERRTTVSDPVKVVQGDLSVVIRSPLYRDDRPVGHVQGVFEIGPLIKHARDILDPSVALRLEDNQGHMFFGETSDLAWTQPMPIVVGDGSWKLSVAWKEAQPGAPGLVLMLIWLGGGLLLVSLLYILHRIQSQSRVLALAVNERTADLLESQRSFATLLSNLPGVVYRCRNDPDWTIELISDGARALTGYAPDEFAHPGRIKFADLIHPDDRATCKRRYLKTVHSRCSTVSLPGMTRPNGCGNRVRASTVPPENCRRSRDSSPTSPNACRQTRRCGRMRRNSARCSSPPTMRFF